MASLEPAIRLFHHRWSVPITAQLYRDGPHTFADLVRVLAASRETLAGTLERMEENGVVVRLAGPKPEWDLTPLGREVGAACLPAVRIIAEANSPELLHLALRKWPMMVLVAVGRGASRYNEIKTALTGITARALALALKDLHAAGIILRTIKNGYPPTATYTLAPLGEHFFPVMDNICRAADGATGD
jgi:DNA-binding HxlR family transcriptional regulator